MDVWVCQFTQLGWHQMLRLVRIELKIYLRHDFALSLTHQGISVYIIQNHLKWSRTHWLSIFGIVLRQLCVFRTPKWLSWRLKYENYWMRDQVTSFRWKYLLFGWLGADIRHWAILMWLRGLATITYFMKHRMMKWLGTSHWIRNSFWWEKYRRGNLEALLIMGKGTNLMDGGVLIWTSSTSCHLAPYETALQASEKFYFGRREI